jgi:phosphoserine phosphatase
MTAEIILVRHGQTQSNITRNQMGRSSEDLDPEGMIQAQKISARLADLPIAAIYSSPLQRALSTAREIARPHNMDLKVLDDLTEIDFGEWQGLFVNEIEEQWPDLWHQWIIDPSQMTVPGGESFAHIAERVARAFKTVINENPDSWSLIVAHEIVLKMVVIQVLGAPQSIYRHFFIANASFSRVQVRNNRMRVISMGDTSHLERFAII